MRTEIAYPYKSMAKYPGMRPNDVAIWDEFILSHPDAFIRVWYDVHLGNPVGQHHDEQEMKDNGMYDVSCWCVDVVAEDEHGFWAIEVKPNAMAGALGQSIAYAKLLQKDNWGEKPIRPAVLTDDMAPITQEAAVLMGVILFTP